MAAYSTSIIFCLRLICWKKLNHYCCSFRSADSLCWMSWMKRMTSVTCFAAERFRSSSPVDFSAEVQVCHWCGFCSSPHHVRCCFSMVAVALADPCADAEALADLF
ncbi:MAG: hypothetical protein J6T28_03160 [Paludibacteraceae bacterium]|nr:hypothetical protein [Paludibacteraceae bacterium]MBP5481507.1 hypothetical protein [Paludibacteraceae bacterium]